MVIRPDGFISLDEVMGHKSIWGFKPSPTMADIFALVAGNDKKRFELQRDPSEPETWLIRAVQGHTIKQVKDEELLEPITRKAGAYSTFNFKQVVHGTYHAPLKAILGSGLCKMARNHVHMCSGLPGKKTVISGMRGNVDVVCEVDINRCVYNDIPMFISPQNRVILSPGLGPKGIVPANYLRAVFDY